MPPKKSKRGASSAVAHKAIKNRSKELDFDYDPTLQRVKDLTDTEFEEISEFLNKETNDEGLDVENTIEIDSETSVINYYISLIDAGSSLRHVFQIFVLFFASNLLYLYFKLIEEKNPEDETAMEPLISGSCFLLAVALEFVAALNSSFKNYQKKFKTFNKIYEEYNNEDTDNEVERPTPPKRPELPEFNYIYSIYLPLAICLLKAPFKTVLIAACVVQIAYMNSIVRILVSYVILFQFGSESSDLNFGETMLTPIVCLFFYSLLDYFTTHSLTKAEKSLFSIFAVLITVFITIKSNITLIIFQKLFISFMIGTILSYPILELYKSQQERSLKYTFLLAIYMLFLSSGLIIADKLLLPIIDKFYLNWLIEFISISETRTSIFKNWIIELIVLVPALITISVKLLSLNFRRKIWHLLVFVSLFKPIIVEPELVSIALVGIFGVFLCIEMIRSNELPPFGNFLKKIMKPFQDTRDNDGEFVTSYIFLILGISIPLWLNNVSPHGSSVIGLVTLGLGDSSASIIGKQFGKTKWPQSNKTIEGSLGFALATMFGLWLFKFYGQNDYNWVTIGLTSALCAFIEGVTDMNDNLLVPMFGYFILELLDRLET